MYDLYHVLNDLTVPNYDDGCMFTDTQRLDRIRQYLADSPFHYEYSGKLFRAYAQVPFNALPKNILAVSSHVDFKKGTCQCFSDSSNSDYLVGTYDNSITNAAVVSVLLEEGLELPKNLVVVFTGDEEVRSGGAKEFVHVFKKELGHKIKCIVTDVTEDGYLDDAVFTIENDCWKKKFGMRVMSYAKHQIDEWKFIPYEEADIDETTKYHKKKVKCFSFCIPVLPMDPKGDYAPSGIAIHSAKGVKVSKGAYIQYVSALMDLICELGMSKKELPYAVDEKFHKKPQSSE